MSLRATRKSAITGKVRTKGILLDTSNDIKDLQIKVARIKLEYNFFIIKAIEETLQDQLIVPIWNKMRADGRSEKIIRSTRLSKNPTIVRPGVMQWMIISDYTTASGFPVSIMIEFGRKAFTIVPVRAKALHWIDKASGEDVFAMKANIPVFKARKFINNTIRENKRKIQAEINEKTERFIGDILRS